MKKETPALTKDKFTKLYKRIRNFKVEPLIINDNDIEIKYFFDGCLSLISYTEETKQYGYDYFFFDQLKTSNKLIRKIYEYDPQAFDDLLLQEYGNVVKKHETVVNNMLTEMLQSLNEEEKKAFGTMQKFDSDYSIETVYETYLDDKCRVDEVYTELSRALELVKRSGYCIVKKDDLV